MTVSEDTFYRLEFKDETIAADQRPSDYEKLLKTYLDREFETDGFDHFEYSELAFHSYTWHGDELVKCSVIFKTQTIIIMVRS